MVGRMNGVSMNVLAILLFLLVGLHCGEGSGKEEEAKEVGLGRTTSCEDGAKHAMGNRVTVKGVTYKLERELGAGVQGQVWIGQNVENAADRVAIKFPFDCQPNDCEKYAVKQILDNKVGEGNQHIIQFSAMDTNECGDDIIVSQLIPGFDVSDIVERMTKAGDMRPFPQKIVKRLLHDMAVAAKDLHKGGLYYLDWTMRNVRVLSAQRIKDIDLKNMDQELNDAIERFILIDMGKVTDVKHARELYTTASGFYEGEHIDHARGPPEYVNLPAGDQSDVTKFVNEKWDVYMLGCRAYWMLTRDGTHPDWRKQGCKGVSTKNLPKSLLKTVISKMISPKPADRPTMEQVVKALVEGTKSSKNNRKATKKSRNKVATKTKEEVNPGRIRRLFSAHSTN